MKAAVTWLNDVGRTAMDSAFSGKNPPGCELEKLIACIQADALVWARQEHLDSKSSKSFDASIDSKIKSLLK